MPELPEVETTRRGISPHLLHQTIDRIKVRNARLRWPVPGSLQHKLKGQPVQDILRRGKYLLIRMPSGTLIIHLGMSGSLRITDNTSAPGPHDHIDLILETGQCLRYHDPRRFGCWLWTDKPWQEHSLLRDLGPEPLTRDFSASYLHERIQRKNKPIKTAIMDSHLVVGVGNIYANEALYLSKIRPDRPAGDLTLKECQTLCHNIKTILRHAISRGGTTLRDYINGDGKPGYFALELMAYGRGGLPCQFCGNTLLEIRLAQRTTVYCPSCQP